MKYVKVAFVNVAILVGLIALGEFYFRYQTSTELEYKDLSDSLGGYSYYIHHHPKNKKDDHAVVRLFGECDENNKYLTVMYLGDSWVQHGGFAKTISDNIYKQIDNEDQCLRSVNAGISSYSPSLYMLKYRLLSKTIKPDIVIINIDETDLMDEWVRYREVSYRDDSGRLIAVSGLAGIALHRAEKGFLFGLNQHTSYLYRFLKREFLRNFVRRLTTEDLYRAWYEDLLGPQLSLNPAEEFSEEISYFRLRYAEMIDEITADGVAPDRIFIAYHPHYLGVEGTDNDVKYNDILPRILSEISAEKGVEFYNATGDIKAMHGQNYADKFRWPEDKFSHLTKDGYKEYGNQVFSIFKNKLLKTH